MAPFRILVLDDNPGVRTMYRTLLSDLGYKVFLAASVGEAREQLSSNLIHLAIIDVRLNAANEDDKQGLEFCAELDSLTPRMILTAYEDWSVIREALKTNAATPRQRLVDAFLIKDVDPFEQHASEIRRILTAEYEIVPEQRFAVLTSGGDAPGMNAAIWSIVRTAMRHNVEVIGVWEGYDGLIKGQMQKLKWNTVSDIMNQSGTILFSARSDDFYEREKRKTAVENIIKKKISCLIVIGGDGSMKGAHALADEVAERGGQQLRTIAIPGTIDNDLYGTDMSLGAASAANAMIESVCQMANPARALRMIFVVEVMGAHSGFLALETAIGTGADAVVIPEQIVVAKTDDASWKQEIDIPATKANLDDRLEKIFRQFESAFASGKRFGFVIQAEGLDRCTHAAIENFRDQQLANDPNRASIKEFLDASYTERRLKEKFEAWPKAARPAVRVQKLGYTVRGVLPSRFDVWLGAALGKAAVEKLIAGETNVMVGWNEREGIVIRDFESVVTMSNRSPQALWRENFAWNELAELHGMLVDPLPPLSFDPPAVADTGED